MHKVIVTDHLLANFAKDLRSELGILSVNIVKICLARTKSECIQFPTTNTTVHVCMSSNNQ